MDEKSKILIIEDNIDFLKPIKQFLELSGFTVFTAENGKNGIELFFEKEPDLVLLDLELPIIKGFDVLRTIRLKSDKPFIILTGYNSSENQRAALELGACDFVCKPPDTPALILKIKYSIAQYNYRTNFLASHNVSYIIEKKPTDFECKEFILNFHSMTVINKKGKQPLTKIQFSILMLLLENANNPVTHDKITESIWEKEYIKDIRIIDVHICELRQKIEDNPKEPKIILTVPCIGYMLKINLE